MALIKTKVVKGISAEYWMIASLFWSKEDNMTQVALHLFVNKAVRQESLANQVYGEGFAFSGNLTLAECYAKIKESKMSEAIGIEGEEGYVAPAETNWFVDAVDDL